MDSKVLVVTGATGFQGRSVIKWFQQHFPAWSFRGLTRDSLSNNAVALEKTGVEVVKADFEDLESLKTGFAGADYIFAFTDFASIMKGPQVMGKFHKVELDVTPGVESSRIEFRHGKHIADAAATVPSLQRLVWSALPHVKRLSNGKYSKVHHFDAKAEVFDYMLSLEALHGKVSAAHMGAFMTNAINRLELFEVQMVSPNLSSSTLSCYQRSDTDLKQAKDGTAIWQPPYSPDTTMPFIDIEKDAGAFVKALIDAPAPTQLLCVSEHLTPTQWMETWSRITGIEGRVEELPAEAFLEEDPIGFKASVLETGLFVRDFGFTGGDKQIMMPEEVSSM